MTRLTPASEHGSACPSQGNGWILPEDVPSVRKPRLPRPAGSDHDRLSPAVSAAVAATVTADRGSWVAPPPRSTTGSPRPTVRAAGRASSTPDAAAARGESAFAVLVSAEPAAGTEHQLPLRSSRAVRWRRPLLTGAVACLFMLSAGAPTFGDDAKALTVEIDGATRTITTEAATVGDALATVGIPVHQHDIVAPSVNGPVVEGATISIRRGRLVTADVDGHPRRLWTTVTSVGAALQQLGLDTTEYRISADRNRPIGPEGLTLSGQRLHLLTVTDGGRAPKTLRAPGATVADVLAGQGISLSKTDTVKPAAGVTVADGSKIVITRIAAKNRTLDEKIAQPAAVSVPDASLGRGVSKVTRAGLDGVRRVTITRTVVNGKASEKIVADKVLRQPQAKRISVGTKETGEPASWSVPWDKMAFCESTSRWQVNTGNGTYGGLQFKTPTWLEYGGGQFASRADLATKEQQIIIAERLYAHEGLAPWHCARLLGWGFGKYQG